MKDIKFQIISNLPLFVGALLSYFIVTVPLHAKLPTKLDLKDNGKYIRSYYLQLMKKPFTQSDKKKALIIGDSHAQDFLNAVHENGYLSQYQISTRYIPTRCQIYSGRDINNFIKPSDKALCAKSDSLLLAKKQIEEADLVILSAKWQAWSARALPKTIERLKLSPKQTLVVIGTKSFGRYSPKQYKSLSKQDLLQLRKPIDDGQQEINSLMSAELGKNIFVNVQNTVCGSPNQCPLFTDHILPISIDGGHLTKDGARFVGQKLFKNPILAAIK